MSIFKNKFGSRLAIAKTLGFLVGLFGFFAIPYFMGTSDMYFRVGILFWYTTLGVVVGLLGVMNHHPVLNFKTPFWFRGTFIGAWLNLVLVFFIYDQLALILDNSIFVGCSPLWFVLEGAIVGLFIDYIATKYAGEGKKLFK